MLIGSACGRTGSSPLARGAHTESAGGRLCLRLIPTHAGNIGTPQLRNGGRSAHPRSRGEHKINPGNPGGFCGSSPPVRRAHQTRPAKGGFFGLIPARAGNTTSPCCSPHLRRAHPRSRGEHCFGGSGVRCLQGSSPLARGTRRHDVEQHQVRGLIPARAGNTNGGSARRRIFGAHPRSRGEHHSMPAKPPPAMGSSPLARGTPFRLFCGGCGRGLIPARAGNTHSRRYPTCCARAHPRSRGEHVRDSDTETG